MRIAGLAIGLFLAALLLHLIIWRIRIPRRQSAALLVILLAALPLGLATDAWIPFWKPSGPLGFWQYVHIAVFYCTMSLGYVVAYSALEERSPSMTLLTFVADAGPRGRTRPELEQTLARANPVENRLEAMIRDHMVVRTHNGYQLTRKGRIWARTFSCWLRWIGAARGG